MPAPLLSPSDRPPGIPVTIHPGQDLHLRTGLPLGALRGAVAVATGRVELLDARLYVGDRALDEHHVVGHPPLVAGALLRTAPAAPDPTSSALEAPLHLAYLAGPRAGFLHPVVPGTTSPSTGAVVPGVRVRVRAGRRDRHHVRVRVRPEPSSQVTVVQRTGHTRRLRRLRLRRWTPWKPGTSLEVTDAAGRTTSRTELRERPALAEVTFGALKSSLVDDATGRAPTPDATPRSAGALLTTALLPAVASVALAVALRNPVFAVMALVGPLVVLGPVVARRRRARLSGSVSGSGTPTASRAQHTGRPCPRAGLRPADLLTAARPPGTRRRPGGAQHRSTVRRDGRPHSAARRPPWRLPRRRRSPPRGRVPRRSDGRGPPRHGPCSAHRRADVPRSGRYLVVGTVDPRHRRVPGVCRAPPAVGARDAPRGRRRPDTRAQRPARRVARRPR
ncbi:hypothetical protein [Sanguibacter sp. 25GB23B1]|uniref:hypothetical protein n=1 Tax=Sanguibacter sp. 25GB23B1 TaxID=3156067 RepID=UPI0032AFF5D7